MICVVAMYVIAFITPLGKIQIYFNGLPLAAPISIVVAILALITIDGEYVLDINREAKNLPWGTIMFLGSVMLFGGIMGNLNLVLQHL